MTARQWMLSALFASLIALKVAEAAFALASWPISNVSMFSGVRPRQFVPFRPRLEVRRDGRTFELRHTDFLLSRDEFAGRLVSLPGIERRCGRLVALLDRAPSAPRASAATIVYEPVFRPGLWSDAAPWRVECILPPPVPPPVPPPAPPPAPPPDALATSAAAWQEPSR